MTARDPDSGVTVILTTGVWEGQPRDLPRDVTVIHALVANMGDEPILLAPGDLELRDLRGFRYRLLDAGASFHRMQEDRTGPYGRSYRPDYDIGSSDDFLLLETFGDIGRQALPWGVLQPGTQMRGFLYFEPVAHSANGAELLWRVGTPEHRPVVDLQFDFYVSRES